MEQPVHLILLSALITFSSTELVCPSDPLGFVPQPPPPPDQICQSDTDCLSTEKCCFSAGSEVFICKTGVNDTSKPGVCPPPRPVAPCLLDYIGGCTYDSECGLGMKCCETSCGYRECDFIATVSPVLPPSSPPPSPVVPTAVENTISSEPKSTAALPPAPPLPPGEITVIEEKSSPSLPTAAPYTGENSSANKMQISSQFACLLFCLAIFF